MRKSWLLWLIISQDTDLQRINLLKRVSENQCYAPYLHFQIWGRKGFQIKHCTHVSSKFDGLDMSFAIPEKAILYI